MSRMSTIQYPYSKWLRDQSQYPTDFDLTSIRLNWTETLVWNGPLSAEDQLPSRIIVWRYFGKIYWVETTKLLLLAWHLLHWQISFNEDTEPKFSISSIFSISSNPQRLPSSFEVFLLRNRSWERIVGKSNNFSNITFSMVWFGKPCQHLFFICFVFATTGFVPCCRE